MANIKVYYHPQKGLMQEEVSAKDAKFQVDADLSCKSYGLDDGKSKCRTFTGYVKNTSTLNVLKSFEIKPSSACWIEAKILWANKATQTSGFIKCITYAKRCAEGVTLGATKIVAHDIPQLEDAEFEINGEDPTRVDLVVMQMPGTEDEVEWACRIDTQEMNNCF